MLPPLRRTAYCSYPSLDTSLALRSLKQTVPCTTIFLPVLREQNGGRNCRPKAEKDILQATIWCNSLASEPLLFHARQLTNGLDFRHFVEFYYVGTIFNMAML
ncbi:uncharacterized protein LOC113558868 [Rhopalosiphum maidis]|uniref:uncharacterized protein LOC113558868 n=1 Tax=Rhopalosiphum maidis TaxID=43146 RepID=UPI000F0080C9|nr:uncharacterized protein LOC113558868 [Rhopalosiphum maidis]